MDYGLLFALVEWLKVWYVLATALGALLGAITNFVLNRHWSFVATDGDHNRVHRQAVRYFMVSGGSLALNTLGVYALTDGLHVHYAISVFAVSTFVGIFFNFPLHRGFVFK